MIQCSVTPCLSAAKLETLDGHAIGHGIGEWHADLDHVCFGGERDQVVAETLLGGKTCGEKADHRHTFAAYGTDRISQARCRSLAHERTSCPASSVVCKVGMSLSPRPERPTRMRLPRILLREFACAPQRMGAFQRRQHAFVHAAFTHAIQRVGVQRHRVLGTADVAQQRMLGTYARVVEAGGYRVCFLHLAILILQQQRVRAMQHTGPASGHARSIVSQPRAAAAGFHAIDLHAGIAEEGMEQADGV